MKNILFILSTVLLLHALPMDASAEEPKTRLRSSQPIGTFRTRAGGVWLSKVSVEVSNVGEVVANEVRVQIELPDGTSVSAFGNFQLQPKERGSYVARPSEYVVTDKRLKATVQCSNCYR